MFALAVAVVGAILLLYTLSELGGLGRRELGGYACLFQLLLAALIGGALTADLIDLFVWFEVAALSSYGLTGFFLERPLALEAAFKIGVLTTMASFGIFIGAGLLYATTGALNYGQLHAALGGHVSTPQAVALGLLVAGFATKAGLVPFHGWLADAHTAAPGPVSALFSALMVAFGVLGISRVAFGVYGTGSTPVLGALMVIGLASALVGAVMALAQDDLKRLLAYDTVSQMGIVVVGLAAGDPSGVAGGIYHLVNHALFKALLFLCAGAIVHRTGLTKLSEMGGLARRMPVIAAGFVLGALSIAGIPPLNGYVSLSLIHSGLAGQPVPYALTLAAQVITAAALGRAAWLAFFRPRAEGPETSERLRPGMLAGLAGLGALLRRLRRGRAVGAARGDGARRVRPAAPGAVWRRGPGRHRPAARAARPVQLRLAGRADLGRRQPDRRLRAGLGLPAGPAGAAAGPRPAGAAHRLGQRLRGLRRRRHGPPGRRAAPGLTAAARRRRLLLLSSRLAQVS